MIGISNVEKGYYDPGLSLIEPLRANALTNRKDSH